ncbi:hypothetical protein D3C78_1619540 [compost metagenome]
MKKINFENYCERPNHLLSQEFNDLIDISWEDNSDVTHLVVKAVKEIDFDNLKL